MITYFYFLIYMIITYYNYKKMWVSKMKDNGDAMNTSFVSFRIGDILEWRLFGEVERSRVPPERWPGLVW